MAFFMHRAFRWFLYTILALVAAIWLTLKLATVTERLEITARAG